LIRHHFTVDVEEHFQVSAFEPYVPRAQWARLESRVERNMDVLLELLDGRGVRGTFFVLGWLAERKPAMVRTLAAQGHEVASHGWAHRRVAELTPESFRESVRRTKRVLEDLAQREVTGYRAPSFSIRPGSEWALDILVEEGYAYDSSLFPIHRRGYGYANGHRAPHWLERPAGRLAEIPPTTVRMLGVNLPAAGGAYFRVFPYQWTALGLREAERCGHAATFYLHPWEVDPEQPRMPVPLQSRLRHYTGLRSTLPRLRRLLDEFDFTTIEDSFHALTP
jgi:polysaccharide deacetylase family protein (PEP-CTERM system associated)